MYCSSRGLSWFSCQTIEWFPPFFLFFTLFYFLFNLFRFMNQKKLTYGKMRNIQLMGLELKNCGRFLSFLFFCNNNIPSLFDKRKQISPEKHQEGLIMHSFGWPKPSDVYGGSFMYHLHDNQVLFFIFYFLFFIFYFLFFIFYFLFFIFYFIFIFYFLFLFF